MLASIYEGDACQAERGGKFFQDQERMVSPPQASSASWLTQEVVLIKNATTDRAFATNSSSTLPKADMVYVRNQKAVSTTLYARTGYTGPSGAIEHLLLPFRAVVDPERSASLIHHLPQPKPGTSPYLRHSPEIVYFTFVREPIQMLISGYLEVMCRLQKANTQFVPLTSDATYRSASSVRMPRSNATAVFRAFLEDLDAKRYIGFDAFHVWTQAQKIDALPLGAKYGFIGRASTDGEFDAGIGALFPSGSIPPHYDRKSESSCKQELLSGLTYGPEEERMMCKYLRADFVCFGYPLPGACAGAEGGGAAVSRGRQRRRRRPRPAIIRSEGGI